MESIQEWVVIILAVVGGASSIVLGLEKNRQSNAIN